MFTRLLQDIKLSEFGTSERGWGKFTVINAHTHEDSMIYREKLLIVKPDTPLQLHKHLNYTELWISESPFSYILEDENGELIQAIAEPFTRVFIPKNRKHKIINDHPEQELKVFEVQIGTITDEDNIRFE